MITTAKSATTPAPWVNVIANPGFGTVVSESGSAYTWALNAHEYRITPWSNDPVSDTGGEAFYLRDEETGKFWCPSPFPVRGSGNYITTHGFGYSRFEHMEDHIHTELTVFVDVALPVKFVVLKIKNESGRERQLSVTAFMEIILGDIRSKTNMHILPERDMENGALIFRNKYNTAFADRVTFFRTNSVVHSHTTDRSEFIGRNRTLENPQAMQRSILSGHCIAGTDTCAGLQVKLDLQDGMEKEIVFQLGNAENTAAMAELIRKFRRHDATDLAFEAITAYWADLLGAVQIETPDPALDLLANGWLSYQTFPAGYLPVVVFINPEVHSDSGDQLQDVLALLHTRPELTRQQILLCASRQFEEGDVQHWWHPPEGRGVRTRCSDDLLWLPFSVSCYIKATGDYGILSASVPFLAGRLLHPGEEVLYDLSASAPLKERFMSTVSGLFSIASALAYTACPYGFRRLERWYGPGGQ